MVEVLACVTDLLGQPGDASLLPFELCLHQVPDMELFTVFFVVQCFTDYDLFFIECLQYLCGIRL